MFWSLLRNLLLLSAASTLAAFSGPKSRAAGVVFTPLYSFDGTNGSLPVCSLVQLQDGRLVGSTSTGGPFGCGSIFEVSTNGTLLRSVPFDGTNGCHPPAGLLLAGDGNLYGVTGQGNIFRYSADGSISNVYWLNGGGDGSNPLAGLALGPDGALYGTTASGGTLGAGTIFRITTNGVFTRLFTFGLPNTGAACTAPLILASDNNFYGTTSQANQGTVFRLTQGGLFTNLASFKSSSPDNGHDVRSPVAEGPDGRLYGTAASGGTFQGFGTIFVLPKDPRPTNDVTVLVRFNGTNGDMPNAGLLLGSDGNFYGCATSGGASGWTGPGTIFQMAPSGQLTTLVSLTGTNGAFPGGLPSAALIQGTDGQFYGSTAYGGLYNAGTVFRLTVPLVPIIRIAPQPDGSLLLTWNSVAGMSYQVQSATDLNASGWNNVGTSITADQGSASVSVTTDQSNLQRFLRILLLQ